jgi:uncharacterized paraquat-inducible protein A
MVRLHWFWRMTISVVVGAILSVVAAAALFFVVKGLGLNENWFILIVLAPGPPTVALYAVLTRAYGPQLRDGETHCRKCDYILRGLLEPRCSECGERI